MVIPSPFSHGGAGFDMVLFDYGFDSLINFVFNFPIMLPTTRRSAAFFLGKTFARVQIILYICSVDFTPFFI